MNIKHWLRQRTKNWLYPEKETGIIPYAKRELLALGYIPLDQPQEDGPNKWIQENLLELLRVFDSQDHSGASAPYAISMFKRLTAFQPLCPLTGENHEWQEVGPGKWQNKRCGRVFKDSTGVYDINGKIFREPDGSCFTNIHSCVYITFPYTPEPVYVNIPAEFTE